MFQEFGCMRYALFFTCVLLSLATAFVAYGACAPLMSGRSVALGHSSIRVNNLGLVPSAVSAAIGIWAECGNTVPSFATGGNTSIEVNVIHYSGPTMSSVCGSGATGCGCVDNLVMNGIPAHANIHIFDQTASGSSFCDPAEILAHELGHVLGLDNSTCSGCSGRIMAPNDGDGRAVHPGDCSMADLLWRTPSEGYAWAHGSSLQTRGLRGRRDHV